MIIRIALSLHVSLKYKYSEIKKSTTRIVTTYLSFIILFLSFRGRNMFTLNRKENPKKKPPQIKSTIMSCKHFHLFWRVELGDAQHKNYVKKCMFNNKKTGLRWMSCSVLLFITFYIIIFFFSLTRKCMSVLSSLSLIVISYFI